MSTTGAGASFAAWTAQRVEVYLALAAPSGGFVTVRPATPSPVEPARVGTVARVGTAPVRRLPGAVLAHGEHPRDAALRAAEAVLAPLDRAGLRLHQVWSDVTPLPDHPGLHVLRLVFEADRGLPVPVDEALLHSPLPAPVTDEVPGAPPRVQRPAAYALVLHEGEVLLSRLTGGTLWTLPGGGIDHGEHPDEAVRRETVEETGLELASAHLVDVDSQHFTGRSPRAVTEDFHGVRLLYRGAVARRDTPVVQEVGGTTEEAAWWPLEELGQLRLSTVVRTALALLG
jgi:ADP-ribose pyrophosphatase YjhB (NUDIX family)